MLESFSSSGEAMLRFEEVKGGDEPSVGWASNICWRRSFEGAPSSLSPVADPGSYSG